MTEPACLTLDHVTVAYHGRPVLEDVTMAIPHGGQVAVVGPNGAGKSTLFKALVGLLPLRAGRIELRDRDPDAAAEPIAYVPQREEIDWSFPVTVADVVMMGRYGRLGWLRRPRAADREVVARCLEELSIADLAARAVGDLSGGQQQRVFIARALLRSPDLLLLDEPTSGVDVALRHELLHLLAELRSDGMSVVLTTHDLNGVATHLPTLACLNRTIIACGETSSVLTPEILELTYGASMEVLEHGGMRLIVDSPEHTHPGFAHSVRPLVEENQR